ncbi:hypothetical protein H4Q26_006644 [Puccinia striiformis f. sp. tritici PST-130]|nr:hypothetical protein H4Q26_006644 [Puccinia striiformis f. sp. tritici PST-130]
MRGGPSRYESRAGSPGDERAKDSSSRSQRESSVKERERSSRARDADRDRNRYRDRDGRDRDSPPIRDRGRDYVDRDLDRDRDGDRDRPRDPDRDRDRPRDRERGQDHSKSNDRDADRDRDRHRERPRDGDGKRRNLDRPARDSTASGNRDREYRDRDRSRSPDGRSRRVDRSRHKSRHDRSRSRSRSGSPGPGRRGGRARSGGQFTSIESGSQSDGRLGGVKSCCRIDANIRFGVCGCLDRSSPDGTRRPDSGIAMDVDPNVEDEDEEAKMARMMGFSALTTTKGKHVSGNDEAGTVDVVKVRTWRQYMNRQASIQFFTYLLSLLLCDYLSELIQYHFVILVCLLSGEVDSIVLLIKFKWKVIEACPNANPCCRNLTLD